MKKIILFVTILFIIVFIFSNSYNNVYACLEKNENGVCVDKEIDTADKNKTTVDKKNDVKQDINKNEKNNFVKRAMHPCEQAKQGITDGFPYEASKGGASKGALRYNVDCAPFHSDEILDLTGSSQWSIVSWIKRVIGFFYRLMYGMAMVGFVVASYQYFKAGILGQGGFSVGFAAAKNSFTVALIGFLIGSSAWMIVVMWTRFVKRTSIVLGEIFKRSFESKISFNI